MRDWKKQDNGDYPSKISSLFFERKFSSNILKRVGIIIVLSRSVNNFNKSPNSNRANVPLFLLPQFYQYQFNNDVILIKQNQLSKFNGKSTVEQFSKKQTFSFAKSSSIPMPLGKTIRYNLIIRYYLSFSFQKISVSVPLLAICLKSPLP